MWCYNIVLLVAVISAANAKNIQEDELVRDVARNTQIRYYLYSGSGAPDSTTDGTLAVSLTGFVPGNPVVVIIHGHRGYYEDAFSTDVRRAIFQNDFECNLFVMDWNYLAGGSYSNAVKNVVVAATNLATFLNEFLQPADIPNVRLIGFGIGAHLAGIAGKDFNLLSGGIPIGQIVGLDPPSKSFSSSNTNRLSSNHATYVEVIHTDCGLFGSGIGDNIGDVDFFVNGGSNQPGCVTSSCNHDYAYDIYASSINNHYTGYRCSSKTQVSLNTCRGLPMLLGGIDKPIYHGYYRVNTPKNPPKSSINKNIAD